MSNSSKLKVLAFSSVELLFIEKEVGATMNGRKTISFSEQKDVADVLEQCFSLTELNSLAYEIDVDPENIKGEIIETRAMELVKYACRTNKLLKLIDAVIEERKHIADDLKWVYQKYGVTSHKVAVPSTGTIVRLPTCSIQIIVFAFSAALILAIVGLALILFSRKSESSSEQVILAPTTTPIATLVASTPAIVSASTNTAIVRPTGTSTPVTSTATLTPTATSTNTPIPLSPKPALLQANNGSVLVYAGPGIENVALGTVAFKEEAKIIGKTEHGEWLEVEVTTSGKRGWVAPCEVKIINEGSLDGVPITWNGRVTPYNCVETPPPPPPSCLTAVVERQQSTLPVDTVVIHWQNIPTDAAYYNISVYTITDTGGKAYVKELDRADFGTPNYTIGDWEFDVNHIAPGTPFIFEVTVYDAVNNVICTFSGNFTT